MKWMGDVMSRDGMNGRERPDECLVSRSLPQPHSALLLLKLLQPEYIERKLATIE